MHLPTASVPEPRIVWQGVHKDLARSARIRALTDFILGVVKRDAPFSSGRLQP